MRKLTRKQKRLLKEEFERLQGLGIAYPTVDDIPHDIYLEIDNINPCEIYWQNVNRFFDDLVWERE